MRPITGRLAIALRAPGGAPLLVRRARNAVLQSGAAMLAAMFRGEAGAAPTGFAVGLDATPPGPPFASAPLTTTRPDGSPGIVRPAAALAADAISVATIADELLVRVTVRGVLPADAATSPDGPDAQVAIAEAALGVLAADGLSLSRIYNRVVFEPVPKTAAHELALFWEIDFPYGA